MYAKLKNNQLEYVPKTFQDENGTIFNYHLATEEVWQSHGFKPVVPANPPDNINNYRAVYDNNGTNIVVGHWELLPPTVNANALASLLFVKAATEGGLDDATLAEHPQLFPIWDANLTGRIGLIVQDDGKLYKAIHAIGAGTNPKPATAPASWTRIADPGEEFGEWFQPIGAHDAYNIGDKVAHNNKHWISTANGNVWEPGIYGWDEIIETNGG